MLDSQFRDQRAWFNKITQALPEAAEDVENVKDRLTKQTIESYMATGDYHGWDCDLGHRYRGSWYLSGALKEKLQDDLELMKRSDLRVVDRTLFFSDRSLFSKRENRNRIELSWQLKQEA